MSKIFPQPCFLGFINIKEIASLNIFEGTLRTTFLEQYKECYCLKPNYLSCN